MRPLLPLLLLAACGQEPTEALPEPEPFTVLTYNVHGLPDMITAGDHTLPIGERMARIAPLLAPFDLVGLQEDFDAAQHATLVGEADHPVRHWFDARVAPERAYGSGLAQLTRLGTEVDYEEVFYEACHGLVDAASDCLASKGLQVLTLDLGGDARLTWLNTHHEAGGGSTDEEVREGQVDQVLALLAALPENHAVVFTGDFNLSRRDPPDVVQLDRYVDAGLRNACDEVDCPEPERIDMVWVRDGTSMSLQVEDWAVQEQLVDETGEALSDHEGIGVTLSWSR
ncbi:MAG: endonuclease/exonuclease/phosphatase family protein [Alphaproteobacteria bacterium]|nr:endonuclease/exonuclease/phosphatase family protein [Alphaproteobacteria bacterium]